MRCLLLLLSVTSVLARALTAEPPTDAALSQVLVKVGGITLEQAVNSQELDWSGKHLNAADVNVLAYVVSVSNVLTTFVLNSNQIGDVGATAIAQVLKVNKVLKVLRLFNNKIGDAGAEAISEALKVNTVLKEVRPALYIPRS